MISGRYKPSIRGNTTEGCSLRQFGFRGRLPDGGIPPTFSAPDWAGENHMASLLDQSNHWILPGKGYCLAIPKGYALGPQRSGYHSHLLADPTLSGPIRRLSVADKKLE